MNFFERRRTRKHAAELLRHARHVRNMREDVTAAATLEKLGAAEASLRMAVQSMNAPGIEGASSELAGVVEQMAPRVPDAHWRENLEVVVVAIAVAMAFRTYFIQPFKIPTGSMQPTLYGVHSRACASPSLTDRLPMKLVKWAITGEWYVEKRATSSGLLVRKMPQAGDDPSVAYYRIGGDNVGGRTHRLPRDARLLVDENSPVSKGDLLWRGIVTRGDHVFVDKIRWNFTRPKRGDIIVFSTDDIPTLEIGNHYIKRLVGLPGDMLSINPPSLLVDGHEVTEPQTIARINRREGDYKGYRLLGPLDSSVARVQLRRPEDRFPLGAGEYFALGDNTGNSRDSRFWGTVPQANAVGPAFMIYWPVSPRWGLCR
jgi:signal peptidase I